MRIASRTVISAIATNFLIWRQDNNPYINMQAGSNNNITIQIQYSVTLLHKKCLIGYNDMPQYSAFTVGVKLNKLWLTWTKFNLYFSILIDHLR